MRVLFTVSNWAGDYFCMIPLGWALQAAGHDVRVACTPGQSGVVARTGLTPVPVLAHPDMMSMARVGHLLLSATGRRVLPGMPLPLHPFTGEPMDSIDEAGAAQLGLRLFAEMCPPLRHNCDAAVELARAWRPELVCYSLMSMEGALAGRIVDAPSVYHSPGLIGSAETEPALDLGQGDPTFSFPRHGVPAWGWDQVEYVVDPSPPVTPAPIGTATRLPVRYVPYNGPGGDRPERPRAGSRPRVTVIWGSSGIGIFGPDVPALRLAIDAALDAGAEVVLTTTQEQADALGDLPAGVRVLRNHPLHLLLATSDAIVHHGSANTLMTGAAEGVPQLALGLSDDSYSISRRLTASGAVRALPGLVATAGEIREAMGEVLGDPAIRKAATELRDDMAAMPAPADLVPALEALAGR
ncbi:nucleotide disphospho-sugar-binding domain-containing protein [Actinoplanes sp. NPDC049548]|uniref:nucleotide disphospho-sugar-binding domain-containing protein n=1 Tax=Actinoplanes sp. NPDC049548 TaxID=3155152 RepID=UPI00342629D4